MARNEQSPTSPQQLELFLELRYLNIKQVADFLGIPKSFIYRRTARGHGDPIPTTGSAVISVSNRMTFRSGSRATVTSRK